MTRGTYHYECPFTTCTRKYVSPVELSEYPWCPENSHTRAMNFHESESSGIPRHVQDDTGGIAPKRRKNGGNWITP